MPQFVRWWCWGIAAMGLAIMVLDHVSDVILGTHFDNNAILDALDDLLQWVIALLGFVLVVGGCVAGGAAEGSRRVIHGWKLADD